MSLAKKYSKIPNLYRPEAQSIFNLENVVVTEKLDGTNFSFGLVKSEPRINSRNNQVWGEKYLPAGKQIFHNLEFDGFGFVDEFKKQFGFEVFDMLKSRDLNNILIYGEFYGKGVQKRVLYGEQKFFAFFDAYDLEEQKWLTHVEFMQLCKDFELPTVSVLYVGPPKLSVFEKLLNEDSTQAKKNGVTIKPNLQEGIVIKGLESETDKWGERIIAKFKPDKFAEKQKQSKKVGKVNVKGDVAELEYAEDIAMAYVTESRLENCLEKLRGMNKPMSIKITKDVIEYMQNDVIEELEGEQSDKRFNERLVRKFVGKASSQIFHNWLKSEFEKRIQ